MRNALVIFATAKRYLVKLLDNGKEDEFAQNVVLKIRDLWNAKKEFLRGKPLTLGRICRMANREAKSHWRSEKGRKEISLEDITNAEELFVATETADSDQRISEAAAILRAAFFGMPPQRRQVFKMIHDDHKTYKEVAETLAISMSTVRTHNELGFDTMDAACMAAGLPRLFAPPPGKLKRQKRAKRVQTASLTTEER